MAWYFFLFILWILVFVGKELRIAYIKAFILFGGGERLSLYRKNEKKKKIVQSEGTYTRENNKNMVGTWTDRSSSSNDNYIKQDQQDT